MPKTRMLEAQERLADIHALRVGVRGASIIIEMDTRSTYEAQTLLDHMRALWEAGKGFGIYPPTKINKDNTDAGKTKA